MRLLDLRAQYEAHRDDFDRALSRVVRSGMFLDGTEASALEAELSAFLGGQVESVVCASGSDALVLALRAAGVESGDEVVVPAFTFAATAEAVVHLGAAPVFADVDASGLISRETVEPCLTERTRAVLAVSLFGQIPDLPDLARSLRARNAVLIEDAAQSFGAERDGRLSCTFGLATTSFFPGKPLGAWGKGGAVFTADAELAARLKALRNHGQMERGIHAEIGWNSRMDELQAAVLRVKLALFLEDLKRRRELAALYFTHLPATVRPLRQLDSCRSTFAQFTVLLPERDAARSRLTDAGIPTAVHYRTPLHLQPAFAPWRPSHSLPVAESLSREILSLPLHPALHDEDVLNVCRSLAAL